MTKKMFRAVLTLTMAGTMLASCGGGGNSSSQSSTSTSNRSSSGSASTSSAGTDALQPAKLRV